MTCTAGSPVHLTGVTAAPEAPILLTNPARARVLPSQTATFSITAWSRSPMRYQWQKGTFGGNMLRHSASRSSYARMFSIAN